MEFAPFFAPLPLIQAPLAGVQDSAMAIAVSQAEGVGSVPCAMLSLEALERELFALQNARAQWTNVNFFCHTPPTPSPEREARWRELLRPYYEEYGIDPNSVSAGAGRVPFTHDAADVLEPFAPPLVSFHFGLPSPELVQRVRRWGARVISSATTLAEARWLVERGVDAVIAQGVEAGGHRGMFLSSDLGTQIATRQLLQEIVGTLDVPAIAAGGIATAEDVRDMLALGASAVQVGTSYMLCHESLASPAHRAALADAERETTLTHLFTGRPARGIVNRLMQEVGALNPAAPEFPLATAALAPLRAAAEKRGLGDFTPLWSGSNRSGLRAVSAAEMTRELVRLL